MNNRCPHCGEGGVASRLERVSGKEAINPSDGDPCMCTICGQWSIWHADGLAKPDKAMAQRIKDSPEAYRLKLGWLIWRLTAKRREGLPEQELLDIRNNVTERCTTIVNDALQLVRKHREALEIYLGVMLAMVQNAAIVYGSEHDELEGEECVEKVLEVLANALADLEIDQTVTERLGQVRAEQAARDGGAGA